MEHLLNNPVYHALCTGNAALSFGTDTAKYFDESVSPFAGFNSDDHKGFDELYQLLPPGRVVLYATPQHIAIPGGWQQVVIVEGLQFVWNNPKPPVSHLDAPTPLHTAHIDEMVALTALTKPGPFGPRTIEFGNYHGIFTDGKLVAMSGERLRVGNYCEVSAVCTHPEHLGRGYAGRLLQYQVAQILHRGLTPFLHVRADNSRAIALYERMGFAQRGPMHFYVLRHLA